MSEITAAVVLHRMEERRDAYVYAITVDGVVRYIGKGIGPRMYRHKSYAEHINRLRSEGQKVQTTRFYNQLAAAIRRGSEIRQIVVAEGLTESEAYAKERDEIASIQSLWNTFSGGIGCTSDDAKRVWKRPDHRERHKAAVNRQSSKAKVAEASAASWLNHEKRAKRVDSLKQSWSELEADARARRVALATAHHSNTEVRARLSASIKRYLATPEGRQQRSATSLAVAANSEFKERHRAAMRAACATDKAKATKSAASKRLWENPERRAKQTERLRTMWTPERRAIVSHKMKAIRAQQKAKAV